MPQTLLLDTGGDAQNTMGWIDAWARYDRGRGDRAQPGRKGGAVMTVVEFPLPDRPITEDEIDKLHSKAFRGLEGPISDCENMAKIAAHLMRNASTMDGELVFAVCNTAQMLTALMADYQAAWYGEKQREPS
jgi:hypothetical protein